MSRHDTQRLEAAARFLHSLIAAAVRRAAAGMAAMDAGIGRQSQSIRLHGGTLERALGAPRHQGERGNR